MIKRYLSTMKKKYSLITQALLRGQNLDFRFVTEAVLQADQWGAVTDGVIIANINLGTVV